jgi:hypothetical protein
VSTAIDAAIVAALQADVTLAGLAVGGVYPDLAPESVATPYVVVQLESHEDIEELGTTAYEEAVYIVTAVDKGDQATATATNVNAAYNRAHAVLASLTVSGYTVMDIRRRGRVRQAERDGPKIWRFVGGRYVVKADPA